MEFERNLFNLRYSQLNVLNDDLSPTVFNIFGLELKQGLQYRAESKRMLKDVSSLSMQTTIANRIISRTILNGLPFSSQVSGTIFILLTTHAACRLAKIDRWTN